MARGLIHDVDGVRARYAGLYGIALSSGSDDLELAGDVGTLAFSVVEETVEAAVRADGIRVFRAPSGLPDAAAIDGLEDLASVRESGAVVRIRPGEVSFLTREIVVGFREGTDSTGRAAVFLAHGVRPLRRLPYIPQGYLVDAGTSTHDLLYVCKALDDHKLVSFAEPNLVSSTIDLAGSPTDPGYGQQWHLGGTDVPEAWDKLASIGDDIRYGSPDIVIGVLDKGIVPGLPAFKGRLTSGARKVHELLDLKNSPPTPDNSSVWQPHGISVAAMATAMVHEEDVRGVAPNCRLMSVVRPEAGPDIVIADALCWMAGLPILAVSGLDRIDPPQPDRKIRKGRKSLPQPPVPGADVINCSWFRSWQDRMVTLKNVLAYLHTYGRGGDPAQGLPGRGTIVVFAGGWSDIQPGELPAVKYDLAARPETISVPGCAQGGQKWNASVEAGYHDVCAPGKDVITLTSLKGEPGTDNGTSLAAPQVAGMIALMLSIDPTLGFASIRKALRDTADKIGGPYTNGYNPAFGYGRANADQALGALMSQATTAGSWEIVEASFSILIRAGVGPAFIHPHFDDTTPPILIQTVFQPPEAVLADAGAATRLAPWVLGELAALDVRIDEARFSGGAVSLKIKAALEPWPVSVAILVRNNGNAKNPPATVLVQGGHWPQPPRIAVPSLMPSESVLLRREIPKATPDLGQLGTLGLDLVDLGGVSQAQPTTIKVFLKTMPAG